jgi:hypothetical protein
MLSFIATWHQREYLGEMKITVTVFCQSSLFLCPSISDCKSMKSRKVSCIFYFITVSKLCIYLFNGVYLIQTTLVVRDTVTISNQSLIIFDIKLK